MKFFPNNYVPLQSFFSEEVSFGQGSDEFLLVRIGHLHGHPHRPLADDEEGVASRPLPDDVVPVGVVGLLQHVGDLDEGVLREVLEYGNAGNEKLAFFL